MADALKTHGRGGSCGVYVYGSMVQLYVMGKILNGQISGIINSMRIQQIQLRHTHTHKHTYGVVIDAHMAIEIPVTEC